MPPAGDRSMSWDPQQKVTDSEVPWFITKGKKIYFYFFKRL